MRSPSPADMRARIHCSSRDTQCSGSARKHTKGEHMVYIVIPPAALAASADVGVSPLPQQHLRPDTRHSSLVGMPLDCAMCSFTGSARAKTRAAQLWQQHSPNWLKFISTEPCSDQATATRWQYKVGTQCGSKKNQHWLWNMSCTTSVPHAQLPSQSLAG